MAITFADRDAVDRAISDVRNDGSATNWALFSYAEGSKTQVVLEGSGSGGHAELTGNFKAEKIQYALLRVNDTFDNHTAVKFVVIFWVGEKVKALQRALIATHKGAVTEFLGQHHVALYASNLSECAESVVMTRVTDASGSSSKVLNEDNRTAGNVGLSGSGAAKREVGGAGTGAFAVVDEESVRSTIATLRKDDGGKTWVLLSYQGNSNSLEQVGSGSGALAELVALLRDDGISYGLFRTTVKVDESVTVKFVKIVWVGESIPAVRKAKVTTHKGAVEALIGQAHVDIYASHKSEITAEIVTSKVNDASGVAVHVREDVAHPVKPAFVPKAAPAPAKAAPAPAAEKAYRGPTASATAPSAKTSAGPSAPKTGGGNVSFQDEETIRGAIADLRKSGNDWVLVGYQANATTLELVGSGSGGLAQLKSKVDPANVYYGLLRTTEKIDESVTTKFVLVIYISDKLSGIKKAKIATHKGAVTEFFALVWLTGEQYHVDVIVSSPEEMTDELIRQAVQKAAGTQVNVK